MLGFHPEGLALSAAILLPNLLFLAFPPKEQPAPQPGSNAMFAVLERVGQAACAVLPTLFGWQAAGAAGAVALAGMGAALALYWACWARYFARGRAFRLLSAPFLRIPLPMAVAPVAYFAFAALGMGSWWFAAAVAAFAAGHLYESGRTERGCRI